MRPIWVAKSEMSDYFTQKGAMMQQRTARVNPSEETIKIGPLGIRFLLTGEASLPGRLMAHPSKLVPARRCAFPEAQCTASITSAATLTSQKSPSARLGAVWLSPNARISGLVAGGQYDFTSREGLTLR